MKKRRGGGTVQSRHHGADPRRMGYAMTFEDRTSGPINAIMLDQAHGTMWGGSSDHGEDYGIGW